MPESYNQERKLSMKIHTLPLYNPFPLALSTLYTLLPITFKFIEKKVSFEDRRIVGDKKKISTE